MRRIPDASPLPAVEERGYEVEGASHLAAPHRLTPLAALEGHDDSVYAVAFSPDGHTLVTAGDDRTARLWDVTDPRRVTGPVAGRLDAVKRRSSALTAIR